MLTEQEIRRSWQRLFSAGTVDDDTLSKAEALLEHLRLESPLRHRLGCELEELRTLRAATERKAAGRVRTSRKKVAVR